MSNIFNYSSRDIIIGLSKVFKLDTNIDLNKILDIIKTKQYTIILATGGDETTNYSTKIEVPQIIHNIIIYKTDTEVKNKCIVDNTYAVHNYPILSRNTFKLPVHIKESHIYTYAFSNGKIITIQPLHRLAHTDGTLSKAFNTSDLLKKQECYPSSRKLPWGGCCSADKHGCKTHQVCCNNNTQECSLSWDGCRPSCSSHRCTQFSGGGACCPHEKNCTTTITTYNLLKKQKDNPGCTPCGLGDAKDYPVFCETFFDTFYGKTIGQWGYCAKHQSHCDNLTRKLGGYITLMVTLAIATVALIATSDGASTEVSNPVVSGTAGVAIGARIFSTIGAFGFEIEILKLINKLKHLDDNNLLLMISPGNIHNTNSDKLDCSMNINKLKLGGSFNNCDKDLSTCALNNATLQKRCMNKLNRNCKTCDDFCKMYHPGIPKVDISGWTINNCDNGSTDPSCLNSCYACKCSIHIPPTCISLQNKDQLPQNNQCCDPMSYYSYDPSYQGCCLTVSGNVIYDFSTNICCDGILLPNNGDYACCKNTESHSYFADICGDSNEYFYDPKVQKCCTRQARYDGSGNQSDPSSVVCDIGDYCGHDMSGYHRCKSEGLIPGKELSFNAQCPTVLTDGPYTPMIDSSTCTSIKQEDLNKLTTENIKYMSCDNIYISYYDTLLGQVTSFCANNDDPRRPSNYPCRDTSAFCQSYAKLSNSWILSFPKMPLNTPAPTPINEIKDCRKQDEECDLDIWRDGENPPFKRDQGDCCEGYECIIPPGMAAGRNPPYMCSLKMPPIPPSTS